MVEPPGQQSLHNFGDPTMSTIQALPGRSHHYDPWVYFSAKTYLYAPSVEMSIVYGKRLSYIFRWYKTEDDCESQQLPDTAHFRTPNSVLVQWSQRWLSHPGFNPAIYQTIVAVSRFETDHERAARKVYIRYFWEDFFSQKGLPTMRTERLKTLVDWVMSGAIGNTCLPQGIYLRLQPAKEDSLNYQQLLALL